LKTTSIIHHSLFSIHYSLGALHVAARLFSSLSELPKNPGTCRISRGAPGEKWGDSCAKNCNSARRGGRKGKFRAAKDI
jgi:hypothetical protein